MQIIREGSGNHFDPDVVAALDRIEDEIRQIAAKYGDTAEPEQERELALN